MHPFLHRRSSDPERQFRLAPLKIAGIYAAVSVLWILFSDTLVLRWLESPELYSAAQTIKGWAFVLCTSLLIFALVRHYLRDLNKEMTTRKAVEADLQERKRALSTLISNLPGMVYRCRNDRNWTMEFVSEGCRDLCGYDPDDLMSNARASYGRDIIHPEDQDAVWRSVQEALNERRPFRTAYRIITRDKKTRTAWEQGRGVFARTGELIAIEGFITDVTDLRDAKLELTKFMQAVEQNASAVLIMNAAGVVEYANPRYEFLTGFSRRDAVGRRLNDLPARNWKSGDLQWLIDQVEAAGAWRGEIKIRRRDDRTLWTEVAISLLRADGAEAPHLLLMMDDVTERKNYEKQLIRHAHFDDLTGLPNRVLANDRLRQAIRSASASGSTLGVFLVGMDAIGRINETLGHEAGDDVLRETARRLVGVVGGQDTVARIAGDEFLILASDLSTRAHPESLAYRLLDQVRRPYFVNGEQATVTASVGVCLAPEDADDAHEIMLNVLAAMKRASAAGGDRFRFFAPELDAEARSRLKHENRIRRGLEEGSFSVLYQPIVDLKSGRIAAAEALVRLEDPDEGAIPPDAFIPVAEETGLVTEISRFVLKEACVTAKLCAERLDNPDFAIAVNVSARELGSQDYARMVGAILSNVGLSPHNLELEVTERAFLRDTAESRSVIEYLRALGVRLAIDDFGTGQTSIAYLQRYPFEKLKLDRSYVSGATAAGNARALASAVLALARELNLRVVGEGVETEEEAIWLRHKGCDFGQGYFFSRPLPRADFLELPHTIAGGASHTAPRAPERRRKSAAG